ncbi:AAA family ATPase [Penicillium malachiteum]|uniref:AAA family ATPase n=1 Tax=Penicillium malachiteum TaxID=1324776 RepID=UPI0025484AA9|nr:AAA family ATPase [Penicillium malachiteum]KAJ5715345.1 AAA family ATPase [Penicillium malachiteum]
MGDEKDVPVQGSVKKTATTKPKAPQKLTKKSSSNPNPSKTALVVRRLISKYGEVEDTKIDIRSPYLRGIFRYLFNDVVGLELNKTPPVADPKLLYWARKGLIRKKEEELNKLQPDEENVVDLETTLQCVEEDWENEINSMNSLLAHNEIMIAPRYGVIGQDQAFFHMRSYYRQREDKTKYVDVEIDHFEGSRPISTLSCYPISQRVDEAGIRERLIQRGRKYMALREKPACRDYHVMYGGREVKLPDGESIEEMFNPFGRVIADPAGYYFHNSASILNQPRIIATRSSEQKELSSDELLICPSWINGFSLASKTWCRLAVEPLADIQWNESAFDKVVLEEKCRTLIHRLVKAHRRDEGAFDDLVQDKGKGLIALLTGTPGVGKTLTAEAVAEVTQRPLYVTLLLGSLEVNSLNFNAEAWGLI